MDLDFTSVYRELAGVDSIIQAAGRCNRNDKRGKEESIVRIFQWEDKERVSRQRQQIDTTKNLLAEGRDITALDNITEYFRRLYRIKGESLDIKKILDKFKDGNYQFATVAGEFNLIEENTVTVYINREPEAEALFAGDSTAGTDEEPYAKSRAVLCKCSEKRGI